MKKILLLLFVCVLLTSCQTSIQPAIVSNDSANAEANEPVLSSAAETGLTLNQAIKIALDAALKWNKEARLYNGTSVDIDKEQTGMDGRRKHWNIEFGIPGKTDFYLVSIRDGEVWKTLHLPNELDAMPDNFFITDIQEFEHDTPELLEKAQQITKLYPGDVFAKGFNFGFSKDPEKNIPIAMVIGWDKSIKNMVYLTFNAKTGEFLEKIEREQYKN
ncbi:hypothetical protein GGQ92_000037 [Gracilibacillus halotolerans]|uniref:Peptidase propeptide and YPEB domain-containing protein n=1 Tax=Gracilibacillus halotolerans TaxID=74386 RepID=A0A841RBK5_9BACI|nr:hypothetical protein [Gracilibacillus halotolerans]MBB6511270.1 hypothetical protein [Gracilibacillus halotolerans]